MPKIRFDRYYRYPELTRLLKGLARSHPDLLRLESIGRSHEGREIWMMIATNFATGPDTEKPALWADGNLHATEVAGSMAVLYFIQALATGYGRDANITTALDTRVFYLVPRVNPDGAEWALADSPKLIRSVTRPYPYDEPLQEGLLWGEDINGDGKVLSMRIPDPNGAWKVHPDDARLLIRRDPVESGGKYYRVLPEGLIKNYDGATIPVRMPREGLDLNRNFPVNWRPEHEQHGAGPYPLSESESKHLVDFIVKHPNITGSISFHTFSAVILRPYDDRSDEELPSEDLWTFQKIGNKGTQITSYRNMSVYHGFRYHPKQITTGGFDSWMYDQRGVFAWTVELWSPINQAGITDHQPIDWFREHPEEHDLKLMKWNDEKLGGSGYVNWFPYDHPQLGRVELGGWDGLYTWSNPPPQLLENEIKSFPEWLTWHALISPRLGLREASATPLGGGTYRLRLVVENTGWLPTYVTKRGLERKLTRGVLCEIDLPEGAALKMGKPREDAGQLEGRAYKSALLDEVDEGTSDRAKVEWVVKAPKGSVVQITARHERAGNVKVSLELK